MKKFLKIAGVVALLLLIAAAGAGLYLYRAAHSAPAFYQAVALSGEERLRAIESVERKVLNLQGELDRDYARLRRQQQKSPATVPAAGDAGDAAATRVAFTGPELDTYFNKWLKDSGYEDSLSRYLSGPRIAVQDGRLILAGRMKDFDAVVSLRFVPSVDGAGVARLRLDGTYVGRLPVPAAAFDSFRSKSVDALSRHEPELRGKATIRPDGEASDEAILLTMQRQVLALFEGRDVSPLVIFPPVAGHGRVPARVSQLQIADETLTLGVELMGPAARRELLDRLKSPAAGDGEATGLAGGR